MFSFILNIIQIYLLTRIKQKMYSLVQSVTFLKTMSLQIDDRSEAGGDLVNEEDLLLREMLARYILPGLEPCVLLVTYCWRFRYEKLDEDRAKDVLEKKISDANLNGLVTKMRRECKVGRLCECLI